MTSTRHGVAFLCAVAASLPAAAFAGDPQPTDAPQARHVGLFTFDILLAGGISSELYVHAEPALEVGILPLGKTGALAVGAGVDLGWCALCGVVTALSDLDWQGSYTSPFGRATLHAGTLGGLIPANYGAATLDFYVGALAGPSFYQFEIADPGRASVRFERVTLRVAPLLGARLGFLDNHLLVLGEYRFNIEGGFEEVTYSTADGEEQVVAPSTVNRRGNEFVLGVGARF